MTVSELKELLKDVPDEYDVRICVETPVGYTCPDGCTIGISRAKCGIDWHGCEFLFIPEFRLKLTQDEIDKHFP